MNSTFECVVRRPRAYTSSLLVNQISFRRPLVVMWYSAVLPGFGHIMLCKYVSGILFLVLELLLNTESHLNMSIYYSMIGKFHEATTVLDTRWFLGYSAVFVFCLRDSYHKCVISNAHCLLADREDSPILPTRISALEINNLDLRSPEEAAVWSVICPGFGHVFINRLPSGFFLVGLYLLTCYMSHLFPAVLATVKGDFTSASAIIDPQWFLYLPSVLCFAAHDAYLQCRALNRAFKIERARFFKSEWQIGRLNLSRGDE